MVDLIEKVLPHGPDRFRRHVLVEAAYEIHRHPEIARLTWLAAFVYRSRVETRYKADATPIPKLSARAQVAVTALAATTDGMAQAELWRGITADQAIGPKLRQFSAAVQQRFGDDTVRAISRNRGGPVEAASVPRDHQAAFTTVSRTVNAFKGV